MAKTSKGQNVSQLGIDDGKKPASHGSGIYHSVMNQVTHDNEYAEKAGSMPNPVQEHYPANKYHGGKTTAKRMANKKV